MPDLMNHLLPTGSIYWKSGLFLFDLCPGLSGDYWWIKIGMQFSSHFLAQLLVLAVVYFNFNFVGYTVQQLSAIVLTWLLSDLAELLYLRELAIVTHGRVFLAKLEKVSSSIMDRVRT